MASDVRDSTGRDARVLDPPYRALTAGVVLSVGLVAFESLGVATVLPEIARRLDGLNAYGWGLSALMLAQIPGAVSAGRAADRRGPALPLGLALAAFAAGCTLAGASSSWLMFLLGRFVQGFGVGAIMGMAYAIIGLAYPEELRARMFALLSGAWTVPSLIGPAVAAGLAGWAGWRGVFVLLLPLIAIAAGLVLPAVRLLPRPARVVGGGRGPLPAAILVALGTGVFVQAVASADLVVQVGLGLAGAGVAVIALGRVTPAGTLRARRGVGAGVVTRFLLCAVYFGSEAFLPLGLTELRGVGAEMAGFGLSAGALTWVLGSAIQAKRDVPGRVGAVAAGWAVLLTGVVVMAAGVLWHAVPAPVAVAGWALGGIGMGVAFNAATTDTMRQAPPGRQGEISAALQLAQTLATALLSGLGGAAIAIAHRHGGGTASALLATFVLTGVLAVAGAVLTGRLRPRRR